ncbi:MAG: hypothetical protein JNM51_09280 [Bacteroidia bacterium]|nr:hypothetical protein [Bacteroidia bacterium]
MLNKWIISDSTGRDIFYFELFEMDGVVCVDSNLVFHNKHTIINNYIEQIVVGNLSSDELEQTTTLLFNCIKLNSYYKQFYLSDSVLNKNGKLHSSSYNILNKITLDKLSNPNNKLMPFSKHYDFDLFKSLETNFALNIIQIKSSSITINKTDFENLLITDLLKDAYLSVYNNNNTFHVHNDEDGMKTYYALKNRKLVFAFMV